MCDLGLDAWNIGNRYLPQSSEVSNNAIWGLKYETSLMDGCQIKGMCNRRLYAVIWGLYAVIWGLYAVIWGLYAVIWGLYAVIWGLYAVIWMLSDIVQLAANSASLHC